MITTDIDAYNIIAHQLKNEDLSAIENKILTIVLLLMEDYSFVDNQTYPRPLHPCEEKRKDAYFTLIAIILSLRTTLENEQKAIERFMKRYSSIYEVVNSDIEELKALISCAGMPQKKAQTILDISNYIIENYSGDINKINNGNIPKTREKLLEIPGVGEKSADCVLELAFNLPSIVVDTNVFRVVTRIFFGEEKLSFEKKQDVLKVKKFLDKNIKQDYRVCQIVHTILLLQGKYICKSMPQCEKCKLNERFCHSSKDAGKSKQLKLF